MPSGVKGKRTYNCQYCNKTALWSNTKVNKFCSSICHGMYRWEYETKPRIESGTENIDPFTLKKYLIEKFGNKCNAEGCVIKDTWLGKPLVLQLDHIDGDSDNNLPSNIQLLCPNCHTQTETFGSKGKGNRYKKVSKRNKYLQEYKNTPG